MPGIAMQNEWIVGSLFAHWDANFPLSVPTIFAGAPASTQTASEWIELWVDAWSRPPQRPAAPTVLEVTVTAHVFVRPGTDRSRIHQLADAVRSTLEHQTVGIRDYDSSGTPLRGWLTLFETETHELTRADRESKQHGLQHVVVSCTGTAHATDS